MTSINPLKFGVAGNQYFNPEQKKDLEKNNPGEQNIDENKGHKLNSNDILSYMAAQNSDIIPVKAGRTINVSKYVTPEQEARIAAFLQGFKADFDAAAEVTAKEFPELSEAAAGDIALAYINASYKI